MNALIEIGRIVKPQGIKGELKVLPITDDTDRFNDLKSILIDGNEYFVLRSDVRADGVYMTLKGVGDRNAAELLRDKYICVDRRDAIKLPEGAHFIVDVIGCRVYVGEEFVGTVKDIFNNGGGEIYELTGKHHIMFPNVRGIIENMDVLAKIIKLNAKIFDEVAHYEN